MAVSGSSRRRRGQRSECDFPSRTTSTPTWPARAAEFRDNIDVVAGIGERLGCRAFNALYGNRVDGASPAQQDELAAENLAAAADGVRSCADLIALGRASKPNFVERKLAPGEGRTKLAFLSFSSGTTGRPKVRAQP